MKRVLTALLLGPLITWIVLAGPNLAFLAVLTAVALLCFYEYSGLVAAYGIDRPGPVGFAGGVLLLLLEGDLALPITLVALAALAVSMNPRNLSKTLPRAAALVFGVLYCFGTLKWAVPLRAMSPYWLLFALAVAWVGDIAAYYMGKAIGRHKLAPSISPGKTWEGSAGSLLGSLAFALLYAHWLLPGTPMPLAAGLAAAANLAGQIGDLAESALKRGAGVKDSGNMLPGHGGWLDRVDSNLFSVPVVYWLAHWIAA